MNPGARAGIVVLGKARGRKPQSHQLFARAAVAALLWRMEPEPRPRILVVCRDAPDDTPDALRVEAFLRSLGVPAGAILARTWSDCTLLETRAVRVLARAHGLVDLRVLTHPYHRARAQRLFDEALPGVRVVAVEPALVRSLEVPPHLTETRREVEARVSRSMPGGVDLLRERWVEATLSSLHAVDPRGRFERWLAGSIRPGTHARRQP